MAEGAGLLNRYTGNCIVGSNPISSANYRPNGRLKAPVFRGFLGFRALCMFALSPLLSPLDGKNSGFSAKLNKTENL